jgi:SAM-dependent methyltransferase
MRSLKDLRGLRYPDEYVIKMFFKEGLHKTAGRVLELGCGSGNNLMLFAGFGWDLVGLDYDAGAIADAHHNLEGAGELTQCDLTGDFAAFGGPFDAVLLPSVNYYIPREAFVRVLQACRRSIRAGGLFYIRSRLPEDWRWGRGAQEGQGAFRLTSSETGERGLLNVFYSASELADLLGRHLGELRQRQQLFVTYDNPQSGIVVRNADVVVWGRTATS